jgi:hypothetical protein
MLENAIADGNLVVKRMPCKGLEKTGKDNVNIVKGLEDALKDMEAAHQAQLEVLQPSSAL